MNMENHLANAAAAKTFMKSFTFTSSQTCAQTYAQTYALPSIPAGDGTLCVTLNAVANFAPLPKLKLRRRVIN